MDKENILKKILRRREPKKTFTFILTASRLIVFACFLYVTLMLFRIDRNIEAFIILFAITLYLILNKLETGW